MSGYSTKSAQHNDECGCSFSLSSVATGEVQDDPLKTRVKVMYGVCWGAMGMEAQREGMKAKLPPTFIAEVSCQQIIIM